jgi:hypothetical protein
MEKRTPKHGPDVKAKALKLLAQGKKPGEIGKILDVSPLAIASWRNQERREKRRAAGLPPEQQIEAPAGAVTVKKVENPGPGVGVPTGSSAGGAAAARAATPEEKPKEGAAGAGPTPGAAAPPPHPFAGIDPAEILIILSKFATSKFCRVQCLMNDVPWDQAFGQWTQAEEMELRMTAPAAAYVIAEWLVKYGTWIGPILFLGSLWEVTSVRVAEIKKRAPKKAKKKRRQEEDDDEEEDQEDEVKYPPTPNGDVPVRSRSMEKEVHDASFWSDSAAMEREARVHGKRPE